MGSIKRQREGLAKNQSNNALERIQSFVILERKRFIEVMKITVAIACYNLEDRIATCLESVISQDYNDMEILVIDDCSTDHSVEVINTMIAKHPERDFHFIVNETNLGLCQVRNISIEEAQGEAIYFIDGDDTIEMGTISLFHRRMVETGVEVVCGSFRKIDTKGNPYIIKQFPDDTIKGVFAYSSYIEKNIKDFFWLPIWNILYRLEFLKTHNIRCATHYRKHEGSLFTFKVVLNAQSVSYIHAITYNWNDVPTSITNGIKRNSNYLEDFRAVIESVVDAKNAFESCHKNQPLPRGARFVLNYIILTQGLLRLGLQSENISRKEKKQFLKWLKRFYHANDMNWSNIVGQFNRLSYLILISPFPYSLFRFYFKHLKTITSMLKKVSV